MKRFIASFVMLLGSGVAADAQATLEWDVAICDGCSSLGQFDAAARRVAGVNFNGEREFLVINPVTNVSKFVTVFNTPPGEVPRSVGSRQQTPVSMGAGVMLKEDPDHFIVFADELDTLETPSSSSFTSSRSATSDEQAQIGAMIEFGKGDFVVVFPDGGFFGSFNGREPAAVANFMYQAMTDKNPGWAKQSLSNKFKQLVRKRLNHYFGRTFQVCGIFNNGDSACFQPDAATPSVEHYVEGSAKNKSGTLIGSGGGGGGGGSGLVVSNNYAPNVAWGPSGGGGQMWLVCSFVGGRLHGCYIQPL